MVSNGDPTNDYYSELLETSILLLGMPRHHAMAHGGGGEVHAFLTSAPKVSGLLHVLAASHTRKDRAIRQEAEWALRPLWM
jgi:hypothetical protein